MRTMRTMILQLPEDIDEYVVVDRTRSKADGLPGMKLARMPHGYKLLSVVRDDPEVAVFYAHPDYRDIITETYLKAGETQKFSQAKLVENAIKLLER